MITLILGAIAAIIVFLISKFFDDKFEIGVFCFSFGFIFVMLLTSKPYKEDQNYIQNLEQKVNIYEQSYDNHVLEDSLVQEV